jgi:hypothetical protein
MWRRKTAQRRLRRLRFFVARAAARRRSAYRPVRRSTGIHYFVFSIYICKIFIDYYFENHPLYILFFLLDYF